MSAFCVKAGSVRGGGGGNGSTGTKCGRWNPTAEQVKVLTDLFRSGLRTPSTDQIQKISTQLSFYGKIESKNVFYWFQNHKARERQKRRRVSIDEKDLILQDEKISSAKRRFKDLGIRSFYICQNKLLFFTHCFEENKLHQQLLLLSLYDRTIVYMHQDCLTCAYV